MQNLRYIGTLGEVQAGKDGPILKRGDCHPFPDDIAAEKIKSGNYELAAVKKVIETETVITRGIKKLVVPPVTIKETGKRHK